MHTHALNWEDKKQGEKTDLFIRHYNITGTCLLLILILIRVIVICMHKWILRAHDMLILFLPFLFLL